MEPQQKLTLTIHLFALAVVLLGVCFFAVSLRRAAAQVRATRAEGAAGRRLTFWTTIGFRVMAIGIMLLGVAVAAPTIDLVIVGGVLAFIVILAGVIVPAMILVSRSVSPEGETPQAGATRDTQTQPRHVE